MGFRRRSLVFALLIGLLTAALAAAGEQPAEPELAAGNSLSLPSPWESNGTWI